MATLHFISHPNVVIDPDVPVTDWPLSDLGRRRMLRIADRPWLPDLTSIWCSTERKARDGAAILARLTGLPVCPRAELGENDRTSTGYLPGPDFEAVADRFFAEPESSVRGWGTARDEQRRIVAAIEAVLTEAPSGDVAVVSHGAVGALLLCHLLGEPIDRRFDQPGNGGGNVFAVDRQSRRVLHGWQPVDA